MKPVNILWNDPIVDKYKKLKSSNNSYLILESEKVINYASKQGIFFEEILSDQKYLDKNKHLLKITKKYYILDKKQLSKTIGYNTHGGVFALIQPPKIFHQDCDKIIYLDGLTSPENIGSICRSAAAFGFKKLLFDSKGSSPFLRRAIRVSTGHVLALQIEKVISPIDHIHQLKNDGFTIVSAHNSTQSISINNVKLPKRICLVIGSEGHGVSKEIINLSDKHIKINTDESVDHLNASIAASVLMFELSKESFL